MIEVMEELIARSRISGSLKVIIIGLGRKDPGVRRICQPGGRGPQPLVRLYNMLISFLAFSGVGIKCSLGMGGYRGTALQRTNSRVGIVPVVRHAKLANSNVRISFVPDSGSQLAA